MALDYLNICLQDDLDFLSSNCLGTLCCYRECCVPIRQYSNAQCLRIAHVANTRCQIHKCSCCFICSLVCQSVHPSIHLIPSHPSSKLGIHSLNQSVLSWQGVGSGPGCPG